MKYAIGIDLGGTSIKTVVVSPNGQLLARDQQAFVQGEKLDFARKIRESIQTIEAEQKIGASWIGLSAPGLAAPDGASIAFMPGRLGGLEGLNWRQYLETRFPIPVLNDAHAALMGEVWLGAAKGFKDVILLTLGTGVGGAILSEGKLLRGNIGRAGHMGHASLDPNGKPDIANAPGSLEDAIGNCTIGERSNGRFATTHELISAHLAGVAEATAVWLKSVKCLAAAVASYVNVVDPEAVIIGGGIAQCGDALFAPLNEYLDHMEWRPGGQKVKVLPATLGEYAGAIGAAGNAMRLSGVKTQSGEWRVEMVPFVHRA
jgi:glucokinase